MQTSTGPKVTVIVPNHNKYYYLQACLDSLSVQKVSFEFEIIVVDNGSTDGSVNNLVRDFPDVQVVSLDQNYHFARAANEGFKRARGEYIALLNNDTEVDQNWLNALNQALDKHPEVGFCASRVLFLKDHDLIDSAGDCYTIAGTPHKLGHRQKATGNYLLERYVFSASASSAIYRRTMLDEIGYFDEDMVFAFEDLDLGFRAQLMGYKCLYVPDAIIYHAVSATIVAGSRQYIYNGQRNIEYVYFKNVPRTLLFKLLPLHLLYILGACFFSLKKGRLLSFLRAKAHLIINIKSLRRKRRLIQDKRRVSSNYIAGMLEPNWFGPKLSKALRE